MGYISIVKMMISCKLHTNVQWMRLYMLTIYIIHIESANIMVSHHLLLNIQCDFIYATIGVLVACANYNLFYSHKL